MSDLPNIVKLAYEEVKAFNLASNCLAIEYNDYTKKALAAHMAFKTDVKSEFIIEQFERIKALEAALAEAEKRITEAACDVVDGYSEFDQHYCCDGRMCGCQGQSVHDMMKHFIRAMVKP